MSAGPITVIGGGPVGLTLALLLARRHVPSLVVDARSVADAKRDRRLLALSRGTLDTLGAVVELPAASLASIRSVVVSSRGEFGRAVLDEHENGGQPLGATVRYGDLLTALDAACAAQPLVEVRRPCAVTSMRQTAGQSFPSSSIHSLISFQEVFSFSWCRKNESHQESPEFFPPTLKT